MNPADIPYNLITILGPTACGKTRTAVHLANFLQSEIISADSRQVYKGMDLGTGKDIDEYQLNGVRIPYHLIDIAEPGSEYTIFHYQKDFTEVFSEISQRGILPILCGGSGMYLEAVLESYSLTEVPINKDLRKQWDQEDISLLIQKLSALRPLHSTTDTENRERLYRALEIAEYQKSKDNTSAVPAIHSLLIGILIDRQEVRDRITRRLRERLDNGMLDETRRLLESGVPPERLIAYGLEYKFQTQYLRQEISFDEMFRLLNTAIHQFAKRQMTWFRRMERKGHIIHWIDGKLKEEDKTEQIINLLQKKRS